MGFEINLTLIGLAIIAIVGINIGAKIGLAKGLSDAIAFAVVMLVLRIVLVIYHGYTDGRTMDVVFAVIMLAILGVIYGVVRALLGSVKMISGLPVIKFVDKALGAVVGVVIVVIIYYVIVTASRVGYFGIVGERIVSDVADNEWLTYLASYDLVNKVTEWKNSILG